MSKRKQMLQCPGSGNAVTGPVTLAKNPKTNCPMCGKRVEVAPSSNRIRKHKALRKLT